MLNGELVISLENVMHWEYELKDQSLRSFTVAESDLVSGEQIFTGAAI